MPITFNCSCGVPLTVRDEPPAYFVRCPKCQATNKVPHPKKPKKGEKPKEDDPGFEVVYQGPRSTAYDRAEKSEAEAEWEAMPYEKPAVGEGYEADEEEDVKRGAVKGSG